jgi:hypothetical protein
VPYLVEHWKKWKQPSPIFEVGDGHQQELLQACEVAFPTATDCGHILFAPYATKEHDEGYHKKGLRP